MSQENDKRTKTILLVGALLVGAGLFFYQHSHNQPALKPSDVDFSRGNHPAEQPAAASAIGGGKAPAAATERPKMNLDAPTGLSEKEAAQWKIFQEVITSRNDNDPRVDQELRTLSPQMHEALRRTYQQMPAENRNSRGLVVFLIARDLTSVEDAQFLTAIYQEQPCLSMADCSQAGTSDPHMDAVNQTSLNYPQLAGLYQLEHRLESAPEILQNPEIRQEISNALREAKQFPGAALQRRAEDIQKKYGL
jgi:hypothetical protein